MNNESEAVDMMRVIIRQKTLILGAILVSVLVAFVFNFFAKRVYQVDSIIEIGSFSSVDGSPILIEGSDQLLEKINKGQYHCISAVDTSDVNNKSCNIKAQKLDGTNLVQIEVISSNPEIYTGILNKINQAILVDHNKKFSLRADALSENIMMMEREINLLKNKSTYGVYTDNALAQLIVELVKRKDQFTVFNPTIVVKPVSVSSAPVNFNVYLTLLFSVFIGLFLGLFVALCREWWMHHSVELKN